MITFDSATTIVAGPAIDDPATERTLRAYRWRAWLFTLIGLAALVVATAAVAGSETINRLENSIGLLGYGGGPVILGLGVAGLFRTRRFRRLLRSDRWATHPVRSTPSTWGQALHLDDVAPENSLFILSATRQRVERFTRPKHATLLVAGLPGPWVVVAPPDRSLLLLARRPRFSFSRRNADAAATRPPYTAEAQAKLKKEAITYLVATLPLSLLVTLSYVFLAWQVSISITLAAIAAVALVRRRWARFPREDPPAP